MIDAVLDSGVLASGVVGEDVRDSTPGEVFRRWRAGEYGLFLADHILGEFGRTMTKPYFRARSTLAQIETAERAFRKRGHIVLVTAPVAGIASHASDDIVLATAVSAGVPFLVSGDHGLLGVGISRGVRIVTPADFLVVLNQA